MDAAGKVLARGGKVASDPVALFEVLREPCLCPERIVLETGTLSFWLARGLGKRGLPVDVIDARPGRTRQMKLQHNKTDAGDALSFWRRSRARAFAATIDDPSRFAKSRAVGAYLGLTTRALSVRGDGLLGGAYPSTATPWCAACSTRPPIPCSRVVRKAHPLKAHPLKAHPLKAHPLKAHPLKDWARPGSGDAAATRRPAWRWPASWR